MTRLIRDPIEFECDCECNSDECSRALLEKNRQHWYKDVQCDFFFVIKSTKKQAAAHQIVLASASKYFRNYFTAMKPGDAGTSISKPFLLKDADEETFEVLLDFVYSYQIFSANYIPTNILLNVLHAAVQYRTEKLRLLCICRIRNATPDECLSILKQAIRFKESIIVDRCLVIADKNADSITRCESLVDVDKNVLHLLIGRTTFRPSSELQLFMALLSWSIARCQCKGLIPNAKNQRKLLNGLLNLVNFRAFTSDELSDILNSGIITEHDIDIALKKYAKKSTGSRLPMLPSIFPAKDNNLTTDARSRPRRSKSLSRFSINLRNTAQRISSTLFDGHMSRAKLLSVASPPQMPGTKPSASISSSNQPIVGTSRPKTFRKYTTSRKYTMNNSSQISSHIFGVSQFSEHNSEPSNRTYQQTTSLGYNFTETSKNNAIFGNKEVHLPKKLLTDTQSSTTSSQSHQLSLTNCEKKLAGKTQDNFSSNRSPVSRQQIFTTNNDEEASATKDTNRLKSTITDRMENKVNYVMNRNHGKKISDVDANETHSNRNLETRKLNRDKMNDVNKEQTSLKVPKRKDDSKSNIDRPKAGTIGENIGTNTVTAQNEVDDHRTIPLPESSQLQQTVKREWLIQQTEAIQPAHAYDKQVVLQQPNNPTHIEPSITPYAIKQKGKDAQSKKSSNLEEESSSNFKCGLIRMRCSQREVPNVNSITDRQTGLSRKKALLNELEKLHASSTFDDDNSKRSKWIDKRSEKPSTNLRRPSYLAEAERLAASRGAFTPNIASIQQASTELNFWNDSNDREACHVISNENAQISTNYDSSSKGFTRDVKTQSVRDVKKGLLCWCQYHLREYPVKVHNFSSSWADGMAFCALAHHFASEQTRFDFAQLNAQNRKDNLTIAFDVAEKNGVVPLLEVDDMLEMGDSPDWKCVFVYVMSFYRQFKDRS